jgi:glycogen operon protein
MRHAGAVRIDHVMALTRLFVVPDGAPALEGAYLAFPLDHLLGELALESHRAQCLVIGEDLGTVPSGFREAMAAAHIASYRVLFFERWGDNFAPPSAYPALALACASTHDLPTLIGWRRALDIMEKEALGLMAPDAAASERRRRRDDLARLFKALAEERILPEAADPDTLPDVDFVAAVHAYIARTPSALALFQIDDLLGETIGVNLPGTDRERPNWRRRLARPVGDLAPAPRRAGGSASPP